jgi:AcrR family transcriptional regulator
MSNTGSAESDVDHIERLPRGRHGLSREEVENSQRERIMRAMALAVGELGYAKTTVAEVLSRAGVSRETFYEQFSDKHECFMAAYDRAAQEMVTRMTDALDEARESDTREARVSAILTSFLAWIAEEPGIARTYYVEVFAAGQEAIEHRVAVLGSLVDLMMGLISIPDDGRFNLQAAMSGIGAIVTQYVSLGQTEQVVELQPQLLEFVLAALSGIDAEIA